MTAKLNERKPAELKKMAETKEISKSQVFKVMYEQGHTIGEIAKFMNAHYSFVYGVIANTYGAPGNKDQGPTKSDKIRELAAEGKTPGEIAKELNSNYSFVHSVVKKWRTQADVAAAKEVIQETKEA